MTPRHLLSHDMRLFFHLVSFSFLVVLAGCAGQQQSSVRVAGNSYSLELPPSLESQRPLYHTEIDSAVRRVINQFDLWGYATPTHLFFNRVEVFGNAAQAKQRLSKVFSTDTANIPTSFSGTVNDSTLFLVSRETYHQIWDTMYTGWEWSDSITYRSLMVHEIAHSEHAFIARTLFGTEDAMGPEWFFEGLAMAVAHQFPLSPGRQEALTDSAIQAFISDTTRPAVIYPRYARIVSSLLLRHPAKELIERGRNNSFLEILR